MRKFVLAAAIATSALGLAACSETAEQTGETTDAMASDADAAVNATAETVDEAATDTEVAVEGAADETAAAADEAAADAEEVMTGE